MLDLFGGSSGEQLAQAAYSPDYAERFATSDGYDSWKLERRQHFREQKSRSRDALARGDWDEALRLLEEKRPDLEKLCQDSADRHIDLYRVRIVEQPLTPYIQWELHSLRLAAECGEKIRVIGPEHVEQFEQDGILPELLTVGADTVYEICYDENGVSDGAIRFIDAEATARCNKFMEGLYEVGEDLASFFEREVAQLEPPPAA
ncbi:MAG TPA: hypothetical protein VG317_09640 [Pseudonocardiaceae bacterium]|jgi:hypothetical protein|nr:hypothetical protein [Pseudonocardiaceae bacterium]